MRTTLSSRACAVCICSHIVAKWSCNKSNGTRPVYMDCQELCSDSLQQNKNLAGPERDHLKMFKMLNLTNKWLKGKITM